MNTNGMSGSAGSDVVWDHINDVATLQHVSQLGGLLLVMRESGLSIYFASSIAGHWIPTWRIIPGLGYVVNNHG